MRSVAPLLAFACLTGVALAQDEPAEKKPYAPPPRQLAAFEAWIDTLERQGSLTRAELQDGSFRFGPRTVVGTVPVLKHERRAFRLLAIVDLGLLGDPAAVPHLRTQLEEQDSDLLRSAALSLALLGDTAGVPVFLDDLTSDSRPVRERALKTLKDMGPVTLLALGQSLPEDPLQALRLVLQLDRSLTPDPEVARVIGEHLQHEDPAVRVAAGRALAHLPAVPSSRPALIGALGSGINELRTLAADALGQHGPVILPELVDSLHPRADPRRRKAAIQALSAVHTNTWSGEPTLLLLWAAHDPHAEVRLAARFALSRLHEEVIAEPLRPRWGWNYAKRVSDAPPPFPPSWRLEHDEELYEQARFTMRARSRTSLKRGLRHDSPRVRQAAVWGVEETGPLLLPLLVDEGALDDSHVDVREQAIRAAARLGPQSAAILGKALTHEARMHPKRTTRLDIVRILIRFERHAAPAAPDLARALSDPLPEVREEARRALAGLGTDAVDAIPELATLTSHEDVQVREPASEMLATIGRDLKKQGTVLWWVVPRVYWLPLAVLTLALIGWFGWASLRPPPARRWRRALLLAAPPLLVACPGVMLMVTRPWVSGFLPESLPTVLPVHLVITGSVALFVVLAALWTSSGHDETIAIRYAPIRGFRRDLGRKISVKEKGPPPVIKVRQDADVRAMAPEAQG